MLHRDVSVNNIMYTILNGQIYFILIDFDMAIVLPTKADPTLPATSKHRTGTLHTMAQELISNASRSHKTGWKPIPHLLRHDYESLFWIALWCVLVLIKNGLSSEEIDMHREIVKKWERGSLDQIAGCKLDLSTKTLEESGITFPPAAHCLRKWFRAWGKILLLSSSRVRLSGFANSLSDDEHATDDEEDEEFDWETAGGLFTRDKLKRALLKALRSPMPLEEPIESEESDFEVDDECIDEVVPAPTHKIVQVGNLKAKRPTRLKIKPRISHPVENDIRSRLRPRRPHV